MNIAGETVLKLIFDGITRLILVKNETRLNT